MRAGSNRCVCPDTAAIVGHGQAALTEAHAGLELHDHPSARFTERLDAIRDMIEGASQGFLPESRSVVDAGIVIFVILSCSYAVEWLQFRLPAFERLMREPKLKLIDNGRLLRRNMRQEFVTEEELMAQVRKEGLEDCREIKAAFLEADGRISFIRKS